MEDALTIIRPRPIRKLLGGAVTAAAAVLVGLLAVPACLLLGLACLIWHLADQVLDALDSAG